MLEVGTATSVGGHRGPLVLQHTNFRPATIHHRLNRQDHPLHKPGASSGLTVVGNLGLLVERFTDAMSNKLSNHRKPVSLHELLDARGYVRHPIPHHRFLNPLVQRLPGHLKELRQFLGDLAHRKGPGRITAKPFVVDPHIQPDDIAFLERSRVGNPVDNFMIDRRTQSRRIPLIPLKGWISSHTDDHILGNLIELKRRGAGLDQRPQMSQHPGNDEIGLPHRFQFGLSLTDNHTVRCSGRRAEPPVSDFTSISLAEISSKTACGF